MPCKVCIVASRFGGRLKVVGGDALIYTYSITNIMLLHFFFFFFGCNYLSLFSEKMLELEKT